jgi:hypothetical protein
MAAELVVLEELVHALGIFFYLYFTANTILTLVLLYRQ